MTVSTLARRIHQSATAASPRSPRIVLVLLGMLLTAGRAAGDGAEVLPIVPNTGCFGIATYGTGLYGNNPGTIVLTPPGPILGAWLHWVGVEDNTPATSSTSTLKVNGVDVVGTQSSGAAGFAPRVDWFSWWANIGPASGPFAGLGLVDDANLTVDLSQWDGAGAATNGAAVVVVYDTGPCVTPNRIEIQMGVDWYFHGHSGEEKSELLVFAFPADAVDRMVSFHVSHAGTDATQGSCRGGAVWMLAGTGPAPAPTAFDLFDFGGGGRGFGTNGGVEVVNDPFTSATLPCTPAINPAPDEPYEIGHPCPLGGSACLYRGVALRPSAGGDVGAEWGVVELDVLVPAGSQWVAFQLESETDQNGESGSWAGSSYVFGPLPVCGDGVLDPGEECDDGNTRDGDGCSAACKREACPDTPPSIVCADPVLCTEPGQCSAMVACTSIAAACDQGPVTVICDPPGPYGPGSTPVVVTASDGRSQTQATCNVTVRDCEPPSCQPPSDLTLECTSPCGVTAGHPSVAAFLASASGADNCPGAPVLGDFAPPLFGSACAPGLVTRVGFVATDAVGLEKTCVARLTVQDTTPPTAACPPPLTLECTDAAGVPRDDPRVVAWLALATASDLCGPATIASSAPPIFPTGCAPGATTDVTFTATDSCGLTGSCTSSITVVDTTPPEVSVCGSDQVCLWPANHKYVCIERIAANITVTDACGPVTLSGIECKSSQCDDAPCPEHPDENGDGKTTDDCLYDPATDTLCARAERAGTDPAGRYYSVTAVSSDACGNESPRSTILTVYVPHSNKEHLACLSPNE